MTTRDVIPDRIFALLFAITIGRCIGFLGTPIALLIAAIQWGGPGHAWPITPSYAAFGFMWLYLVLSYAFGHLARWDLRRRAEAEQPA